MVLGNNTYGQCDVASWTNIVQVAVGEYYVIGLKSNGNVVAVGDNSYGQCNVGSWSGIIQVSAMRHSTIGLEASGYVVAAGDDTYGECDVSGWSGITQVAASGIFTIGLTSGGTVVATGNNNSGALDVSSWTGITQIAAGWVFTLGLKGDGTVVAVGSYQGNAYNVSSWTGIVQVGAGWYSALGLKADGTVVAIGDNTYGEVTAANSWNLGCETITSIQGGGASVTRGDGVATSITGADNEAVVAIGSIDNGDAPPSVGEVSLNGSQYYDTDVTSNAALGAGATATVTISNPSITADSTIQYWYNGEWNTATNLVINTSASPPTISGQVLVSYLTGTPIAIGIPSSSQTWYLGSTGNPVMEKTGGQSGSVVVPAKGNTLWLSDQKAATDVTFPSGTWTIKLKTDADWSDAQCLAEVGDYNPSGGGTFTPFNSSATGINNDGLVTITITVGGTVKEGDYLALEVLNNDTVGHDITTDGSSSLSSPSTDPGYPLPEMSAVILLSFGLAGLGGYAVFKRKKALRGNTGK